jgi:uncharacterized membrane protein
MNTKEFEKSWTDSFIDLTTNVGGVERAVSAAAGGALVAYGVKQRGIGGTVAAIIGGAMLFRGATGHCPAYDAMNMKTTDGPAGRMKSPFNRRPLSGRIHVTKSVIIDKSPSELYQFWRNFEHLPKFMRHLESVTVRDEKVSHWKAKAPLGQTVEWDAELTSDVANERLGWKSLEGSDIANSGVVEFRPTADRGTLVRVTMIYEAPGGKLGEFLAKLFGEEPSLQVADDLHRFKQLMETGRIVTTEGQTSGREPAASRTMRAKA